jgi:hypothetical protein
VPFSPGESGTFNLSGFLVINRFFVKSKVVLHDKWHISAKTEFYEKVPFSPGESGTFNLSGFLVINRFSIKSKVALLDKWHLSGKKNYEKVPFSPSESGNLKLSGFLLIKVVKQSCPNQGDAERARSASVASSYHIFLPLLRRYGASAKRERSEPLLYSYPYQGYAERALIIYSYPYQGDAERARSASVASPYYMFLPLTRRSGA